MAQVSNPRKEFSFTIQIAPTPINPFLVQKVDIPEITVEQATHGDTNHDIKTAGRVKYSNLNLSKIMTTSGSDNFFYDWAASCQDVIIGGGLVPSQYKRTITVSELAEDGTSILNTWVFMGCWPTKISAMKLDRQSSDNTIESIEISIDKMEKL